MAVQWDVARAASYAMANDGKTVAAAADVAITPANTLVNVFGFNVPSTTQPLSVSTVWLLIASICIGGTTTASKITARWFSTLLNAVLASGEISVNVGGVAGPGQLTLLALLTVPAFSVDGINFQVASTTATESVHAAAPDNAQGNTASRYELIRIS